MLKTEKIDEMIADAGYGIELPEDKESRFKMRRLVEHVYKLGCISGSQTARKIDGLIKEWESTPHPAMMHKADEKFCRQSCYWCGKPFNAYAHNDAGHGKGWMCDGCMIDPKWRAEGQHT